MARRKRIGVYGGTFDPLHNAHMNVARAALEVEGIDRVIFVVSARPPHKYEDTVATPEQRLEMVRAAVSTEPEIDTSDLELHREGPSYTAETLRELSQQYPDTEFSLIVGADSLIELPNWREPDAILSLADLLVVPRPGDGRLVPEVLRDHYQFLPFDETDLSSTEVRRRIAAGESIAELVPPAVNRYIHDHGIYDAHVSDPAE